MFYDIPTKVTQVAYVISVLIMHADHAMKPLKCMSESFQRALRNKGPAKRIQNRPKMLEDVAKCWTRWRNEFNKLDSTLGLDRSGSKTYPESLDNKQRDIV